MALKIRSAEKRQYLVGSPGSAGPQPKHGHIHWQDEAGFARIQEGWPPTYRSYSPLSLESIVHIHGADSECWVVNAENLRLLQRSHRKCIRIMCGVTRHHTRKHRVSTDALCTSRGLGEATFRHPQNCQYHCGHHVRLVLFKLSLV